MRLPDGIDADQLLTVARTRGVIYVVGSAFFVDGGGKQFMRLSFSAPPPERIEEGVTRLAAAFEEMTLAQIACRWLVSCQELETAKLTKTTKRNLTSAGFAQR